MKPRDLLWVLGTSACDVLPIPNTITYCAEWGYELTFQDQPEAAEGWALVFCLPPIRSLRVIPADPDRVAFDALYWRGTWNGLDVTILAIVHDKPTETPAPASISGGAE